MYLLQRVVEATSNQLSQTRARLRTSQMSTHTSWTECRPKSINRMPTSRPWPRLPLIHRCHLVFTALYLIIRFRIPTQWEIFNLSKFWTKEQVHLHRATIKIWQTHMDLRLWQLNRAQLVYPKVKQLRKNSHGINRVSYLTAMLIATITSMVRKTRRIAAVSIARNLSQIVKNGPKANEEWLWKSQLRIYSHWLR